jgi:hypothetical protein
MGQRRRLVSGSFGDRSLLEIDAPQGVAEALVANMSPIVVEISRRSGAPGELVLRRNLGEGRREETYCTHSELVEKIMILPPDLRAVFGPLKLSGPMDAMQLASGDGVDAYGESNPRRLPGATSNNLSPASAPTGMLASPLSIGGSGAQMSRPPSVPPPEGSPSVS